MTKQSLLKIRVQTDEKTAFEQAANLAGVSLSAWTRERLRKIARLELEKAGQKVPFMRNLFGNK